MLSILLRIRGRLFGKSKFGNRSSIPEHTINTIYNKEEEFKRRLLNSAKKEFGERVRGGGMTVILLLLLVFYEEY